MELHRWDFHAAPTRALAHGVPGGSLPTRVDIVGSYWCDVSPTGEEMDWARTEVDLARKELDLPLAGLVDLLPSALEATGAFTVDMRRLSAKFDREDALLLPRLSGGFRIVVDPDVSPSDRAHAHLYPDDQSFVAATHAWRIAHEVGHSRYYHASSGDRVVSYVDREEVVADLFAAHLLLPEWAIASDDPGIASFPVLALLAAPDLSARLMGLVVAS